MKANWGNRINVRSVSMFLASLLVLAGIVLICLGIKTEQKIDVCAPFLKGQLSGGFVGVNLLFFGLLLNVFCMRMKAKNRREIKIGTVHICFEGYITRETDDYLHQLLEKLPDSGCQAGPSNS